MVSATGTVFSTCPGTVVSLPSQDINWVQQHIKITMGNTGFIS